MKYLIFFALFFSCSKDENGDYVNPVFQYYCSYESQDKRAVFVSKCIKDANPMSDEEPEDMISGCVNAANRLYCFYGNQIEARRHYKRLKQTLQEE